MAVPARVTVLSGIMAISMLSLAIAPSRCCVSAFVMPSLLRRPTSSIVAFSSSIPDSRYSFLFRRHNLDRITNRHTHPTQATTTATATTTLTQLQQQIGDETEATTAQPPEEYRNKNNVRDQIVAALSSNGEIKVTAATTRNLVNDAMIMQSLTAVPADALGRSMTCALLLSNGMQEEQTFQLTMACDGPIRTVVAIADTTGSVRGYVGNPSLNTATLPEAIGQGTVQVVKNHPSWPNPYNGVTSIRTGDIDRDVGLYLAESEQRACALAAGTVVAPGGILCTVAGGYLVEQLPGCSEETVRAVEENLGRLVEEDGTGVAPMGVLKGGGTPWDVCAGVLNGLGVEVLGQTEPKLVCQCTEERLFRAVRLLPQEDVEQILKTQEQIEARCEFCGKVYRMGPEEVARRFSEVNGDPSLDNDIEDGK